MGGGPSGRPRLRPATRRFLSVMFSFRDPDGNTFSLSEPDS